MDRLRKRASRTTTTTLKPTTVTYNVRLGSNNKDLIPIQVTPGVTTIGQLREAIAKEFGKISVKIVQIPGDQPLNDKDIVTDRQDLKPKVLTVEEIEGRSLVSDPSQNSPSGQNKSPSALTPATAPVPAAHQETQNFITSDNEALADGSQFNHIFGTVAGKASIVHNKAAGRQVNLIGGGDVDISLALSSFFGPPVVTQETAARTG